MCGGVCLVMGPAPVIILLKRAEKHVKHASPNLQYRVGEMQQSNKQCNPSSLKTLWCSNFTLKIVQGCLYWLLHMGEH